MSTFSFRAECPADVTRLKRRLVKESVEFAVSVEEQIMHKDIKLPDIKVEMQINAEYIQILKFLNEQEDSHVIMETLRQVPLSQNNLSRDREVYKRNNLEE